MIKRLRNLFFAIAILFTANQLQAQCSAGFTEYEVVIVPDSYPSEISWELEANGVTVGTGFSAGNTYCVANGSCVVFTINDSYGDGICCAYGNGYYQVYVNGVLSATGGNYAFSETQTFSCAPGTYCDDPIPVDTNIIYTAPVPNTWYSFTVPVTGMYEFSTCLPSNTCDTKIWLYDDCIGVFDETNAGTLFYDDDAGGCGIKAVVSAALVAGQTYIIRIGDDGTSCATSSIDWIINYMGAISGCMDPAACNYEPLATVAGTCYYYPNPLCPPGPDLEVVQSAFETSLSIGTTTSDVCAVAEGCLNGYGTRRIINFTTHIKNVGVTDYFIGDPTTYPGQFSTANCHGHTHYEGYAQYVLYDAAGSQVPIGFKSGFCVMDLECSGGGTFQYGCSNMGISAGCGDIYSSGLMCQWVDITDVADGDYILAIKVNWDQSPDALGRYESDYLNNWGQVCINVYTDGTGNKNFTQYATCAPYTDCLGVPYGNALLDCNGVCGGSTLMGDLDVNGAVEVADANAYVNGIINGTLATTNCNDLSDDGFLSVWDAGLAVNCDIYGTSTNNECNFPNTVMNPSQEASIGLLGINTTAQYIDMYIVNPDSRVVGYEFDLNDVEISSVQNLINPSIYNITPAYLAGGSKVIGLSYIDSMIPKNTLPAPLCRIYYSSIGDSICVNDIVHILNNNYEPVQTTVPTGCFYGTSTNEIANGIGTFLMYPNPANDKLTVVADVYSGSNYQIVLRDMLGQIVQVNTFSIHTRMNEIDLNSIANGTYSVELKSEGASKTQLLIVRK